MKYFKFAYKNTRMTVFLIKNMVCTRCVLAVEEALFKHGLHVTSVEMGRAEIAEAIDSSMQSSISETLRSLGFELLDNTRSKLVEQVKNVVIKKIHHRENLQLRVNWSALLTSELHHDYKYLSSLFSAVEGITLEQYIIRQKIEKVKEYLFYDEFTLSEISYRLDYSSVQHLSLQFKKITGQTPSAFKASRLMVQGRKSLDAI